MQFCSEWSPVIFTGNLNYQCDRFVIWGILLLISPAICILLYSRIFQSIVFSMVKILSDLSMHLSFDFMFLGWGWYSISNNDIFFLYWTIHYILTCLHDCFLYFIELSFLFEDCSIKVHNCCKRKVWTSPCCKCNLLAIYFSRESMVWNLWSPHLSLLCCDVVMSHVEAG